MSAHGEMLIGRYTDGVMARREVSLHVVTLLAAHAAIQSKIVAFEDKLLHSTIP